MLEGGTPAPVEVDLTDRFGHGQRRTLTATPLSRQDGDVSGTFVTLMDVPRPDGVGTRPGRDD